MIESRRSKRSTPTSRHTASPPSSQTMAGVIVRSGDQRGTFVIRRKDSTPVRVVYHAFEDIADGIHVSFLLPADDPSSA